MGLWLSLMTVAVLAGAVLVAGKNAPGLIPPFAALLLGDKSPWRHSPLAAQPLGGKAPW